MKTQYEMIIPIPKETFCLLSGVKILTLLFLTAMTVAIFFIAGSSFPTIFLLLPEVGLCFYLYKHLETIFDTKSGDERIFQYIREELNGMIVQKQCKSKIFYVYH